MEDKFELIILMVERKEMLLLFAVFPAFNL